MDPSALDFRALFESSPNALLVVRPNSPVFTIAAASDAYLRAVRKSREEIIGRSPFEVFAGSDPTHGITLENFRASLEIVLATRQPQRMAMDGAVEEQYWGAVNSPVFGPDGSVQLIVHRRAQPPPAVAPGISAASHSAGRDLLLGLVVENSPDFIGISDLNRVPVYANPFAMKLVGATDFAQVQNTPVEDYFVPGERAFVREVVLPAVRDHGSWKGELHFQHFSSGEAIPVLYHVFRVDDPETGAPSHFATITRDLRESKRIDRRDAFLAGLDDALRPLGETGDIMQTTAMLLGEYLQVDRCAYCRFENDQDTLEVEWDYTRPGVPSVAGRHRRLQSGSEGAGLLRANLPFVVADIETDPRTVEARAAFRAAGIASHATVPLHKEGRLQALMFVHQQSPRNWLPEEVELLLTVANRCWESIERARVEADLWKQWHTFDTALSNSPDLTFTFDLDGRLTYANRRLLTVLGKSFNQVIGKNIFELGYPEELAARLDRQIRQIPASKQSIRDQARFGLRSDGIREYEYILAPVLAANGRVEAVTGSSRDITDQIKNAKQLKNVSDQLEAALDSTEIGIWTYDIPANRVVGDANMAFLFGLNEKDLATGQPVEAYLNRIHPDDRPAVREKLAQALALGVPFSSEYRAFGADGDVRWLAARGSVKGDSGRQPQSLNGIVLVISERKQAEERLLESERQFHTLAETIPHLAWMADPSGHIFWYNHRWYDYTGTTFEEMEGWGWQKVHDPTVLPLVMTQWKRAIASGEPFDMIFPLKGADGGFRSFLTRVEPVKDKQGSVVRWFGTNTDITEQQKTEDELRRLNRDLEEFAFVASHDLREPLRTVNIYTELILKRVSEPDAKMKQYAAFVEQGVARIEALIDDLLKFSTTLHTEELPAQTANLADALSVAMATLIARIDECGAVIDAEPLPTVRGDTTQMAQVFQNLISNALKYCKKDTPPEIHVSAKLEGETWVVSVRDNGIGFEQQYAERIFGLFKRLHKDEYKGTGLGLAICKRIVERYGGRMWAEGMLGEGATFSFALQRV